MFWNRSVKLCLIALMSVSLAAVACSDDPAVEPTPDANPVTPDAGTPDTDSTADTGTPDATPTPDTGIEPGDGIPLAPPAPKCDSSPTPERCAAETDTFEWGTASRISVLAVSTEEDGGVAECCFDFNGDGNNDNGLGSVLALVADLANVDVNQTLQDSIDDGTILLVLEHDGLTDLASSDSYTVNFLIGSTFDAAQNEVTISPASFDAGAHPQALLPNAKIEGGKLTAGPGSVFLSIPLLDISLDITLRNARVEANVVGTSIDGGVVLSQGKLGGILPVDGIYQAINDFAATCDCLGNVNPLISREDGSVICTVPAVNTCDSSAPCGTIAEYCDFLPIIDGFADLDLDGDGTEDAFSLGLTFEAQAVVITGVDADE